MLEAKKGTYVVKTDDQWVYDVEVYSNGDLIAVVGFSENQKMVLYFGKYLWKKH